MRILRCLYGVIWCLFKIGASLMYLRGVIHMNQNNFDRAKEFFLKAVQVDATMLSSIRPTHHKQSP